jgi:hypothetical protein
LLRRESDPVARARRRDPRQDFGDCDLTDLDAVNQDGDELSGFEEDARSVTVEVRLGVHFDLAIDQVDDPVNGDAPARVVNLLFTTVLDKRRIRNLDHPRDVGGRWVTFLIGVGITTNDRQIGQRFISSMHLGWLIFSDEPASGEHWIEFAPHFLRREHMRRVNGTSLDDESVN